LHDIGILKASWFDALENIAHDLETTRSAQEITFRAPTLKIWDVIVLETGKSP
jgi:hypothetical protein